MAFAHHNRVQETTTSTGTGDLVLEGAPDSTYQAFSAAYSDGDTMDVAIFGAGAFELCRATYNSGANSITRDTVHESSNSDVLVNFGAGDKTVIVCAPGELIRALLEGGLFHKSDWQSVAFVKTAPGTLDLKEGTKVELAGTIYEFASATAVVMPTLTAGTDYAIYVCNDGSVRADASFSAPSGYAVAQSRKIGGFHYAPGGNAAAQAGGDSTPAINEYSLWDLKFRPACPDPRGMTLVADSFWCDIYLLNVDHIINGTSKYNATIADGASPPKVPTAFGGTGSSVYGSLTWWEVAEVMASHGKQLLDYGEFAAAAYGVTEDTAAGSEPSTTGLDAARTSKWGVMQAAGGMWIWGRDVSTRWDGTGGWAWRDNAGGRGQIYIGGDVNLVAALLGGYWDSAYSGSRASYWIFSPWSSNSSVGARGRCDHVCHV